MEISGTLRLVPVSEVDPQDLVDFRWQANSESEHVNRMNLSEAREWVADGDNFILLLRNDDIVGQLVLDHNEPTDLYIDLISVLEEEKGKGGADLLFAYAVHKARHLKCKTLSLSVHRNNERALRFYERRGFKNVRRLGVDALLYSKQIK